jgi:hypothetical protein
MRPGRPIGLSAEGPILTGYKTDYILPKAKDASASGEPYLPTIKTGGTPMDTKDWLQIVVIPVSLALVTLLWPQVQSANRKRHFMQLIDRELEEISPFPQAPISGGHWAQHLRKTFVHQRIFKDPGQSRDFLLTLDADTTYQVSQLWQSLETGDDTQWLHYLQELSRTRCSEKFFNSVASWEQLIKAYRTNDANTPLC